MKRTTVDQTGIGEVFVEETVKEGQDSQFLEEVRGTRGRLYLKSCHTSKKRGGSSNLRSSRLILLVLISIIAGGAATILSAQVVGSSRTSYEPGYIHYEQDSGFPLPWAQSGVYSPIPPNPSGPYSGVDFSFFGIDLLFYALIVFGLIILVARILSNRRAR